MAIKTKKVLIEYIVDTDEIIVKSEWNDPERTLKQIQLGLEKWVKEYIGLKCPHCDEKINGNWEYCSYCGGKI